MILKYFGIAKSLSFTRKHGKYRDYLIKSKKTPVFLICDYKPQQGDIVHKRGYRRNTKNTKKRICNSFVTVL